MASHIYGRINLIKKPTLRPNMFIKELKLYLTHFEKEVQAILSDPTEKQCKSLQAFRDNLMEGIHYYQSLVPQMVQHAVEFTDQLKRDLSTLTSELDALSDKYAVVSKAS